MKLVFCGTPQFAVPAFERLLAAGHSIELTVTQPDRPSGRGMQLAAPPVKQAALAAGLRVTQPEKIRNNEEFRAALQAIAPEAIVVVAYGRIIPKWMLDLPPLGNLNLHASLLPKYRGAAPVQWAIASGERVTGVTIMRLNEGLDTGDILLQREMPIAPDQTSVELFPLLAEMGAELMVEALAGLQAGTIHPVKQDDDLATLAPILTREDGRIDFSRAARAIYDRWRGFQPWPGAFAMLGGRKFTVARLLPAEQGWGEARSGTLRAEAGRLFAACGQGSWIELLEVQVEGRKRLAAAEFLRGHALSPGEELQ